MAEHALKLLDAVKVANPNTRNDLKKDSKKFEYKLDNRPVCHTKDWTKANRDRANEVTLQLEPHAMYTLNYSEHGR